MILARQELEKIYEEIRKRGEKSIYEKFCAFSKYLISIKLNKDNLESENQVIEFSKLKIEPGANISAAVIFFIISLSTFLVMLFVLNLLQFFFYFLAVCSFVSFLVYYYPYLKLKIVRASASSEMVLCITYMTISLSQTPNLENAVVFAYENLTGPIKKDLGDLIKKFFEGKIFNFKDGLNYIADKWYKEGKEFSEALKLLISYSESPYENKAMLDSALSMIVDDSYARMERYARDLRLPTTALVVLGIILPVIGLVLIPMMTIFLPEMLNIFGVLFIYDVFLPFILFLLTTFIIEGRPLTASPVILKNPFEMKLLGRNMNIFLVLSIISIIVIFGFSGYVYRNIKNYEFCSAWAKDSFSSDKKPENLELNIDQCKDVLSNLLGSITPSLLMLFIPSLIFSVPLFSVTNAPIKTRNRIRAVESELPTCLLEIGYGVKSGKPLEIAIRNSIFKSSSFETTKMFEKLKDNISFGYTVKNAIFDKDVGVLKYYNSALITYIFRIITEIAEKGTFYLHKSLLTLSDYLKTVSKLQNKIDDIISEPLSTLKFMAFVLTPLVSGIAISLAMIILGILSALTIKIGGIVPPEATGIPSIGLPFISLFNSSTVSPALFQIAIGIYMIEMCIIYGVLINGLENGFDFVVGVNYIAKIIGISMLIYVAVSITIYLMLSGLVTSLLEMGV